MDSMPRIPAEYITSATRPAQFPRDGRPEIALAGRSNVGKSSLINRLLGHKKLARTSSTPGRTQTLNFYSVDPAAPVPTFYLVDMPGYGHASASHARRQEWGRFVDEYLASREPLRAVLMLIDIRHEPQPLDLVMAEWLRDSPRPYLVVATKADKISRSRVGGSLSHAMKVLGLDPRNGLAFSAETGYGREVLWSRVGELTMRRPRSSAPSSADAPHGPAPLDDDTSDAAPLEDDAPDASPLTD